MHDIGGGGDDSEVGAKGRGCGGGVEDVEEIPEGGGRRVGLKGDILATRCASASGKERGRNRLEIEGTMIKGGE